MMSAASSHSDRFHLRAKEERAWRSRAKIGIFVAAAIGIALATWLLFNTTGRAAVLSLNLFFIWPLLTVGAWLIVVKMTDRRREARRNELEAEDALIKARETAQRIEKAKASGALDKWNKS